MLFRIEPREGRMQIPAPNWHKHFAWKPVIVVDRGPSGASFYYVWLQTVERRLVVANGVAAWEYRFGSKS